MRKLLAASASLLLLANAAVAAPHIDTETSAPTTTLTQNDVEFMTLTRRPTLESKLPTNVTIISGDDIRRSGSVNAAEALRLVPGLVLSESGSVGQLTTFRLRGTPLANQSQVLIDDQPLGGVSIQEINLTLIPADQIDHIEVVRGGSSVLYGANTIGGVVHIFMKKRPDALASVGYERQSFNTDIYRAAAGGSFGAWNVRVNGQRYNTDGYMQNSDGHSTTGEGQTGYTWKNGASVQASSSFTDHWYGTPDGTFVPFDRWNGHEERQANSLTQRITNYMFRNRLAMAAPVAEGVKLSATVYHQDEKYRFYNDPPLAGVDDSLFHNAIVGADARATTDLGTVVGGSYERDFRAASGQANVHIYNQAAYVEQELNAGKLTLLPALRLDHHSSFGNQWDPRLTGVFRANERWKLSASAARSFRAPTLVDLYFAFHDPLNPANDFVGNPNLKPEKAWSYDLGTQFVPVDWAEIGLSGFYTSIHDRISAVDTNGDGNIDTSENLGRAEISGVEFEAKAQSAHFSHRAAYTFDRAVGSAPGRSQFVELRFTPHHVASYRLTWTPTKGLDLSNTVAYVGSQYQNDNRAPVTLFDPVTFAAHQDPGKIPAYAVWNFRAEQGFRWGSVYAGVNNILNRLYAESATFGIPLPQPTRTFLAGANVRFGDGPESRP